MGGSFLNFLFAKKKLLCVCVDKTRDILTMLFIAQNFKKL